MYILKNKYLVNNTKRLLFLFCFYNTLFSKGDDVLISYVLNTAFRKIICTVFCLKNLSAISEAEHKICLPITTAGMKINWSFFLWYDMASSKF